MTERRYIFEFTGETQVLNGKVMRLARLEALTGWLWLESGAQTGDRALLITSESEAETFKAPMLDRDELAKRLAALMLLANVREVTSYGAAKLLREQDLAFAEMVYATSATTMQRRVERALAEPVWLSSSQSIQAVKETDARREWLNRCIVKIRGL